MYESQWLRCDDPEMMLRYVLGKTGDRKFRLFACACVRRIWPLVRDERSRSAVDVAERYADRPGGLAQLIRSRAEAGEAEEHLSYLARRGAAEDARSASWAARAAVSTVYDTGWDVARSAARAAATAVRDTSPGENRAQCDLLRDAFGNFFRPVVVDPAWLRWHDGCVLRLAQTIYEQRRFHDLPILADALEEAGCADEEILWHCREPVEHARGCWLLDALMGKK